MFPSSVDHKDHAPPLQEASASNAGCEAAVDEVEEAGTGESGEEDMEIDKEEVKEKVDQKDEREKGQKEGGGRGLTQLIGNGREMVENGNCARMQLRTEAAFGGGKHYLHGGIMLNAKTTNSCSTINQENSLVSQSHSVERDGGALYPANEDKQVGFQLGEDLKGMESRVVMSEVAPGSLSPYMEFSERNKRPAIICDFFMKGWCIRGSSCRFLHVKENPVCSSEHHVKEKDSKHDKGIIDGSKTCPGILVRDGSNNQNCSAFNPSSSVLHVNPGLLSIDCQDSFKRDDEFISSYRDVIRNGLGRSRYDEDYRIYSSLINRGSSITVRSNFLPDCGLSSNVPVRSLYIQESNIPPLDFGSPSSNMSLHSQRLPGNGYTSYKSASVQSPSLFSLHGRETYSFMRSMNKRKISPCNWEPSVPFRPSFSISSVLPSLGNQYDPFLDSIEQPNVEGGVFTAAEQQISANRNVSGCENGHSISSQVRNPDEQVVDKDYHVKEKDLSAEIAETAENSIVDCQIENSLPEENSLTLREISQVDEHSKTLHPSGNQPRPKKDLKDERVRNKIEKHLHESRNAEGQSESKLKRNFRVVLIDFVKALLRPCWDDGRLTKDAHNLIVKKAVDKVISTLTKEQVPTSKDSIKHYLSSSESKISKLLEGYVDKYGKPFNAS
ncbi:hypothetical protein SAY87_030524 [Trapa incisa]|uniref:C3H1-type domain-containing protein n=1 Tax=Trapa incisa TaxID=236973 RepID=A0AAN7KNE2_9MYRT|nr:hypothetical protein SAY87_030524 [Trapa incisa]